MSTPTILLVEDNPTTSKMFRLVIEGEGLLAREADSGAAALEQMKDGAPRLVVMDMVLPDMTGFELASRLRRLPGGTEIPVIALSGFSHLLDHARQGPEIFDAFLFKPVESEHLLETIRTYLPRGRSAAQLADGLRSERILIVDDDPVQLKLARLHLCARFAQVTAAASGAAALSQARSMAPDLIVSDVLMPGMDGFELCMAVRQDPSLAAVPIVLVSAHYADAADDELARGVGASALLPRKADFREIVSAIEEILDQRGGVPVTTPAEPNEHLHRDHVSRARLQLERQLALNVGQAQRAALQSAQLSILGRVANALTRCTDVDAELGEVLATCLDAAGINRGVLYRTAEGVATRVSHAVGFAEAERGVLERVFGHPALLSRAIADSVVFPVTAPPLTPAEAASFLASAGVASAFFVPLLGGGRCVGALLLGSSIPDPEALQLTFCRALGAQIGQALVLADAFTGERTAREVAEEASRAKSRFLGMVSHELLTPLTSIRLQLDRLDRSGREDLPERERHIVALISRAQERLHDLVKSLLEYTRLESGRLEVRPELIDVRALLRDLTEDLQPRAQSKGLALEIIAPLPEAAGLFGTDGRLFRLIASNLVDNAIKFTEIGRVQVSLGMEGEQLRLTVADSGRGIPLFEQSRIFDPFEQLEKAANKHTPGVGLGLAVVKRLAEALGGKIELSSQVGEGSRFSVIIPPVANAKAPEYSDFPSGPP